MTSGTTGTTAASAPSGAPPSSSARLTFRRARLEDTVAAQGAYDAVVDHLEATVNYPDWRRDVYPTHEHVAAWVRAGQLHLALAQGEDGTERIVGVEVLNHDAADGYADVPWTVEAPGTQALLIHTLAAVPGATRHGVGRFLVESAIDHARELGCRAVRLDVVEANEPACRLYRRCGLTDLGVHELRYADTDLTRFRMFEHAL